VFFFLEVTVANFVEPYLYGAHVGLSPLAILVAAIFWTLIWGFPGLVLSTPITVCLVVMGRYLPGLNFLNILLGDEQTLAPDVEYYQRLLASDHDEARRILERCRKTRGLEELYSSVVIPALSLAEHDRHHNELDQPTQEFIYQSTREIVEELGEAEPKPRVAEGFAPVRELRGEQSAARPGCEFVCVPARDEADAVVGLLLAQLLEQQGRECVSIDIAAMDELVKEVSAAQPQVVFISALPPFAVESARALYAKLRGSLHESRIVICFWHFEGDRQRLVRRLRMAEGDTIVVTLPAALAIANPETTADAEAKNDTPPAEEAPAKAPVLVAEPSAPSHE
jgi:hypothetical protein